MNKLIVNPFQFGNPVEGEYEIGSGAALSSALKALKDKGILDEQETSRGSVSFDDPLFAFWLKDSLK